ncbi:hypothetical protein ACCD06_00315 [Azospirillum sp. CT11-132]|uniref:hypothetical protein n=1 Tax=unclassified Azospirillum TaxID=2630922 RepID=UPI000D60A2CC|nr:MULTISPECIES: hypothetical protein [unclassified Azospirillum]PWC67846.1 hypothetical protein TSH7_03320 [Azospirillum sp. TSH7]PWC71149.1 hypothetical protein TSH20_04445 [Azospirillum sp. TSH20]
MALDMDQLTNTMITAGKNIAGTLWHDIQVYAVPELKKIAMQIVAIEESMMKPNPPYTTEGAKALLNMQITATMGVIVAMTHLTLQVIQKAIDTIMDAIKSVVNTALGFTLIA